MLWLPPVSTVVVNVAEVPAMVPVPSVAAPSLNVTVPVAPAVTVAVKVTEFPKVEGSSELVRLVALAARFTVCVSAADVLLLKFESPPYTAVMLWLPPVRAAVENVAVVPEIVLNASVVEPSLKVTEPVAPGVTAAVKETILPYIEGFTELVRLVELAAVLIVWVRAVDVLPR